METDIVGDKIGRIHLGRQDLGELQTRKMKGLKRPRDDFDRDVESSDVEENLDSGNESLDDNQMRELIDESDEIEDGVSRDIGSGTRVKRKRVA